MKNNKLDKIVKDGLKGGNMPYSESYWAEMEKLIPAAPVPAATTAVALGYKVAAFVLAIALLGTAGYFWLLGTADKTDLQPQTPTEQIAAPTPNVEQESPAVADAPAEPISQSEVSQPEKTQHINQAEPQPNTNVSVAEGAPATTTTLNSNPALVSTTNAGSIQANVAPPATASTPVLISTSGDIATGNTVEKTTASVEAQPKSEDEFFSPEPIAPANVTAGLIVEPSVAQPEKSSAAIILPHQKNKKLLFSAGADYQYLLLNRSLSTTNSSLADYVAFRNQYENPSHQTGVGLNVQVEMGPWLFNSGIYSTTYNEEIKYPNTLLVNLGVDNGQWKINQNWNYTVDSTWVIDSIYVGHWRPDTAWSLTLDSLWQPQWDTVATEKEAPELAANNGILSLTYLEIPLWFGRSFGKNRLHFDVQGGLGFGILTGTSGSLYINQIVDGLVSSANQIDQFSRLNLSGMARAGIRYEFTEQLQALVYPTLRYTFTSVFQDAAIRQRYLSYGISVGVLYRF